MMRFAALLTGMIAVLCGCMKPLDADFNRRNGLQDDEMLWVLQIPADSMDLGSNLTELEVQRISQYNAALFRDAIPLIFKDMINGDLNAYENYGTFADDLSVARLNEKLTNLEISKTNFSPLLFKIELFSLVRTNSVDYQHTPKFLRLIAVDTTGEQPQQPFAGVFLDDLDRMNYTIDIGAQGRVSLRDFLQAEEFYFLPSYIRSNASEIILESGEESRYVRDLVADGAWKSIQWVEGQINTSGKRKIEVDHLSGLSLTGTFEIYQLDSTQKELPELYLTAENDYLVADWSNRFTIEKIFPFEDQAYFSPNGEFYYFDPQDSLILLRFISNGDTIKLTGESDWLSRF